MNEIGQSKYVLDTPFLWVDLDQLERNITALSEHFHSAGVQWRPHFKGLKVPSIAHMALNVGAIGLTCAKLSEAEVMTEAGIKDILIANQIVGRTKMQRLVQLCRSCEVKVAVDSEENVAELSEAAAMNGVTIDVLVEVDIGMKRAGVEPGEAAVRLSCQVQEKPGIRYRGLMGWEGQATRIFDSTARETVVREAIRQLVETVDKCRHAGLSVDIVSAGGSATLDTTPFLSGVTEVQVGGAIFCDAYYQAMQSVTKPALFVRSTVTSHPVPDRLVFDAGFKALPAWKRSPEPVGLTGVASISMSAEHGVLTLHEANESVRIGDAFDFVVGYGDQTVFLYDKLLGIRSGILETVWDVRARGKLT